MTLELTKNLVIIQKFIDDYKQKYNKILTLYITSKVSPKTIILDEEHKIQADLDYYNSDHEHVIKMIDICTVRDYLSKNYDLDAIAELFH